MMNVGRLRTRLQNSIKCKYEQILGYELDQNWFVDDTRNHTHIYVLSLIQIYYCFLFLSLTLS